MPEATDYIVYSEQIGPHACIPHHPPPDAPWAGCCREAMQQMPYKGARACVCRDHHRPHLHATSAVDLVAKRAAVVGALQIVRRQQMMTNAAMKGNDHSCAAALVDGTAYVHVPCA